MTDDINGTFSISDDGRIKIIWESHRLWGNDGTVMIINRGIQVRDFAQTENTFDFSSRWNSERFTRAR
jgi:hypothetical protein